MLKVGEQKLFEEYMRWRNDEGANLEQEIGLQFHVHVTTNRPELATELEVRRGQIYQEIARLVSVWEHKRK